MRTSLLAAALTCLLSAACQESASLTTESEPILAEPPDEAFRATAPPAQPPPSFVGPMVQSVTLGEPAHDALFVERHTFPLVQWTLAIPGGSATDPVGKEGRAALCGGLRSARPRDVDEQLSDVASTITSGAGFDIVGMSGFSLRPDLDATLQVWSQIMSGPTPPGQAFAALRDQQSAVLQQQRANPTAIARRVLAVMSRGPHHPYGRQATEASLRALALEDCTAFYSAFFHGAHARLAIAGDATAEEVQSKFASAASMPGDAEPLPQIPPTEPNPARLVLVNVPGTTQSDVVVWSPGPSWDAPDRSAAELVLNVFAGGALGGRLGDDLRQSMGSTYGVSATVIDTQVDALLEAETRVQTDRTAAAIAAIVADARSFRDSGPSEDELGRARDARNGAKAGTFDTLDGTLGYLSQLSERGLPANWLEQAQAKAAAVDVDAARTAAMTYLAADRLHFVIVGDGQAVLPMLEQLAGTDPDLPPGSVLQVDADGVPVTTPPSAAMTGAGP